MALLLFGPDGSKQYYLGEIQDMAVHPLLAPPAVTISTEREYRRRAGRWSFFQTFFSLLYLGIVADIVTTALGFQQAGASYEQNPLGGSLISHLGWAGLFILMTGICTVCYLSFREVYWRKPLFWSAILNTALFFLTILRWLVVIMAIVYVTHPPA